MKYFMQILLCTSLLTSSLTFASDDKTVNVYAPDATAPLQILYVAGYGSMNIKGNDCHNTTCSFKVTGAKKHDDCHNPDIVTITVGKDLNHACQIVYNDNGGFWLNQVRLVGVTCIGDWVSKNLQDNNFIISGQ